MEVKTYTHFWLLLIITFVWCLVNYPIMGSLWTYSFDDGTYSHAYVIPFIVTYLFYILEQEKKVSFRKELSLLWLVGAVLAGTFVILSTWSQISLVYWAASLISLVALVFCVFRYNFSTLFPFVFLVFIFPFWGALAAPLQSLSVFVVTKLMSFTSIPVYVENEFVTIPAGVFEIAEGCSGLRYVIVSASISSLYIFLYLNTFRASLMYALFALVGALITNWIRIVALIVIGHETNMQSSLMTDHNNFGWYLYVPVVVLQFFLGRKLEDWESEKLDGNKKIESSSKVQLNPKVITFTVLIGGVFSSSTAVFTSTHTTPDFCNSSEAAILPEVYNADSICTAESEGFITATYYFYGKALDNKASYYLNSPLPPGFIELSKSKTDSWNMLQVKNNVGEKFIIGYRYGTDFGNYLSLLSLKKARLLNSLNANSSSNIQWRLSRCNQVCTDRDFQRAVF